eukprot:CAMPEP_0180569350 /NCGR_PEP_ID=MMETSP1037_2-20121125/7633_1 /TAXON_ID=632150 /ORGANISM="Azadinium spinosum, Strain 3D9" /LENGTH=51 /DNA_ID=CAMNT_0022586583 /DNA_START=134 /DNA_END=285 /DNA_ORIENTATION=-
MVFPLRVRGKSLDKAAGRLPSPSTSDAFRRTIENGELSKDYAKLVRKDRLR